MVGSVEQIGFAHPDDIAIHLGKTLVELGKQDSVQFEGARMIQPDAPGGGVANFCLEMLNQPPGEHKQIQMIKNFQPLRFRPGDFPFNARREGVQPRAFRRTRRKTIHAGCGERGNAVDMFEDLAVEAIINQMRRITEPGLERRFTRVVVHHVENVSHV